MVVVTLVTRAVLRSRLLLQHCVNGIFKTKLVQNASKNLALHLIVFLLHYVCHK